MQPKQSVVRVGASSSSCERMHLRQEIDQLMGSARTKAADEFLHCRDRHHINAAVLMGNTSRSRSTPRLAARLPSTPTHPPRFGTHQRLDVANVSRCNL